MIQQHDHLFIGGRADGERYPVPVNKDIHQLSFADKKVFDYHIELVINKATMPSTVITENYRRMPVSGGNERQDVFVLETMSNDEAMMRFISEYRPQSRIDDILEALLNMSNMVKWASEGNHRLAATSHTRMEALRVLRIHNKITDAELRSEKMNAEEVARTFLPDRGLEKQ